MRLNPTTGHWREGSSDRTCERAALLITRHIDGELSSDDARELRAHLAVCAVCRRDLDVQASQSHQLTQNLRALWHTTDARAQKKTDGSSRKTRRFFPRFHAFAACGAFAASVAMLTFFASPVQAPSEGPASTCAALPPHIAAEKKPVPQAAQSESPNSASQLNREREKPECAPVDGNIVDIAESVVEAKDEPPIDKTFATNVEGFGPPIHLKPAKPDAALTDSQVQTWATPLPAAPLKPLPGVSLKFSVFAPGGVLDEGRVTVLGDVLNGKGALRIETTSGKTVVAAQNDIDTVLPEHLHSIARKLIRECTNPLNRARIERAIELNRARE